MYKIHIFAVAIMLFAAVYTKAQVTIGAGVAPQTYSVLEISTENTKGGIRMPQLSTSERNGLSLTNDIKTYGLTIYNTDSGYLEYWNGNGWVQLYQYNITNGLSENTGGLIKLGGNLTEPTTIQATASGQNMEFTSTTSGANFVIGGSANLGIGESSPQERLHVNGNARFDNLPSTNSLNNSFSTVVLNSNNLLTIANSNLTEIIGGYRPTPSLTSSVIKTIDPTSSITRVRFTFHVDGSSPPNNVLSDAYLYGDFTIIGRNGTCSIVGADVRDFQGNPASNVTITSESITFSSTGWPLEPGAIVLNPTTGEISVTRPTVFSFIFEFLGGF